MFRTDRKLQEDWRREPLEKSANGRESLHLFYSSAFWLSDPARRLRRQGSAHRVGDARIAVMQRVTIRAAESRDCDALARFREDLWPETVGEEHGQELMPILERGMAGLPLNLVAVDESGRLLGFVEIGLRSHADGCDPAHSVGFIEGWYVVPGHRNQGIGRRLVAAAEDWARSQGCVEMASDTWIDNEPSQHAHQALGYEVVDRCVHYRKTL